MRCRECGQKAAINLRQHRLSLCREHFLEWMPKQTALQIKKHAMLRAGERPLVAVSGGKDSLTLWDILLRLDIAADGLYINLGITGAPDYSLTSAGLASEFASARGLTLHTVDVAKTYGKSIPEIIQRGAYSSQKPCSDCGLVKRYVMNAFALEHGYECVATGHNLDDEASVLFTNTLTWSVEKIARQFPVLPSSGGMVKKIKPLHHFYERETTAYALLRGIDYIQQECPYSIGNVTNANKQFLNQLENAHPGTKMTFYAAFLKAQKERAFRLGAALEASPVELSACPNCSQPTSTRGLCSFCRLFVG